jgi:hypothetical protein
MRGKRLAASIVALFVVLATPAAQAASAPAGHEQILRALIGEAGQGKINYQAMTPDLAEAVRPQAAAARSELVALGALKSVTFETIDRTGSEIYRTTFEHGALTWAFAVNDKGLISNAAYRPLPAGAP